MSTNHGELIALTQGAWMVVSLVALLLLGVFTMGAYFTVSFIGLLAVTQLYAPVHDRPDWWLLLQAVLIVCFVVFGYLVYARVTVFI